MAADDVRILTTLVEEHVRRTGSPQAKWILENWDRGAAAVRQGLPARIQARTGH